jgi:hypothetical protein
MILRDLFKLQASFRHDNVVEEYSRRSEDSVANPSPRTGDSVSNPSQRFVESSRNIYTLSSVSRNSMGLEFSSIRIFYFHASELQSKNYQKENLDK